MQTARQSLVLSALIAVLLIAVFTVSLGPVINNGDYWRVNGSMWIDIREWTQPPRVVPLGAEQAFLRPESPAGLLGMMLAGAHRLVGATGFSVALWFVVLSSIYWSGAIAHLTALAGRMRATCLLLFALFYATFCGFFYSFFEESFTIAILPWLLFAADPRRFNIWIFSALCVLLLTSKSQAIFFFPVLAFYAWRGIRARGRPLWTGLVFLLLCGAAIAATLHKSHPVPNSYNRLFNGLGWTTMQVEDWPATQFSQRLAYFSANREALALPGPVTCVPGAQRLMGTTFWPTGQEILDAAETSDAAATQAETLLSLGLSEFAACLGEVTSPAEYLATTFEVAMGSDYRLEYIALGGPRGENSLIGKLQSVLLARLAPVMLAGLLIVALVSASPSGVIVAIYAFGAAPLFVILGDGFYEFEKHMMPHLAFLLIPAIELLRRRFSAPEPTTPRAA